MEHAVTDHPSLSEQRTRPCRVVKRHNAGGHRIWDVYDDHIGDYLATMNPTLPVSSEAVAQRICDNANACHAARQEQPS